MVKSTDPNHAALLAYQVADASSAAPTCFPTVGINAVPDKRWLIDGGVVANNPTMCAVSEVKSAWPEENLGELRVLSVGTGSVTRTVTGPATRHWGAVEWFVKGHILDVLTDERIVAYQARTLLGMATTSASTPI